MTKIVWSALSDGRHLHYYDGEAHVCSRNHKKVDWKGYFLAGACGAIFVLAAFLILNSQI